NNGGFVNLYSKYIQDDDLFNLNKYVVVAEAFNELNFERNKTFVDNLVSMSDLGNEKNNYRGKLYSIDKILSGLDTAKNIKVIISGGFHTEGINELLREKNISYITLTPNVKKADLIYEQNYLDSIVKQAEADINAISKKPFTEEDVNSKADTIISELNKILEYITNRGVKETNEIIQTVIEQCGVGDIIKFNIDSEGIATIRVDGKIYVLNYEKGKIEIQENFITSLGKNIKTFIKQAFKNKSIRIMLGLKVGDSVDASEKATPVQVAEDLLVNSEILLPGFAQYVLSIIFGSHDKKGYIDDYGKAISSALSPENLSPEFSEAKIIINKTPAAIGAVPDGYGNTEEYGSLFSVTWKNENGAFKAENILISEKLLLFLQENKNEREIEEFFDDLFRHERFEILALNGQSESFNQYAKNLPRTSDVFHEYIRTKDFEKFLEEFGMNIDDNYQAQNQLLDTMDTIISKTNEENSEYSKVMSVSSLRQGEQNYSLYTILSFLRIRSGDTKLIAEYNNKLIGQIVNEIKKEYETEFGKITDTSEFNKDAIKSIINKFVVAYRGDNNYIANDKFADKLKEALIEKLRISPSQTADIFIDICELKEEKDSYVFGTDVKGKRVLFVEDIISRQSSTFNKVFSSLTSAGAETVLGVTFFDLSKETQNIRLSKEVYKIIKKEPQHISDVIVKAGGNVQKYLTLWLVDLYNDKEDGLKILKQALTLDDSISKQLVSCLIGMITNNNLPRNIKPYQIFQLVCFIEFGEKAVSEITKSDVDAFITKYGIISLNRKEPLKAEFSDWEESLEYLIVYASLLGYDYIDLAGISNVNALQNRESIEKVCSELGISFMDRKTKMKHSFFTKIGESVASKEIKKQGECLKEAREAFEQKVSEINKKYGITADRKFLSEDDKINYLNEMEKANDIYIQSVKDIMSQAMLITEKILLLQRINIDKDLFKIVVGGSLVKGNMMADSDIYYDIICPDGSVSKSINDRFAPLYSSVLLFLFI
ncbi:MAG: hypothetical protein II669_03185, partial [Elusimicrobia bacterium]|nr:hypothetical protein [Elusimicrobiota bacterium]